MYGLITGRNDLIDRLPYGTSPKVAPVAEATLKNHIQLTHDLDDDIVLGVGGYVLAATAEVENRANVALIHQQRRQYIGEELLGSLCGKTVELSFGPVVSVTDITYLDGDEVEQTLGASYYRASSNAIYFKEELPTLANGPGTVWVNYVAGYGATDADVPAQWQNLVMMLAMRKYDLRTGDGGATTDVYERMIDQMIVTAGGSRRGV